MDINFSYSIQKIKNKDLLFHKCVHLYSKLSSHNFHKVNHNGNVVTASPSIRTFYLRN